MAGKPDRKTATRHPGYWNILYNYKFIVLRFKWLWDILKTISKTTQRNILIHINNFIMKVFIWFFPYSSQLF